MRYFPDESTIESGSPATIRKQARQLTTVATRIELVSGMLDRVSTRGSWESPSGEAFAEKVGATPADLLTIAHRLLRSAQIIRPYADLLADAQKTLTDLDDTAADADATIKDKDEELKDLSPGDPEHARVARERSEAAVRLTKAEQAHETETREARADEARMAAQLIELCAEAGDPRGYDFFEFATDFGESATNAGIIAKPIALAGVTKPIGLAGRRAFYDEGSYGDVAKASAGYGLDTVGWGAGRVVTKAKQRFGNRRVNRLDDLDSRPVRIKDNPIITPTPTKNPYSRRTAVRQSAGDILRHKSGADDVRKAFDDWEMIAGEGRVAKVAVTVQMAARQGSRARGAAARTPDRVEKYVGTTGSREREEREERQRERAKNLVQ